MDKNGTYPLKQSVNNYCLDTGLFPTGNIDSASPEKITSFLL